MKFSELKTLKEGLGDEHKKWVDQFLKDSEKFDKEDKPEKVERIERVVSADPESGKNDHTLKIWYTNDKGHKEKYIYALPHEEKEGKFKITEGKEESKEMGNEESKKEAAKQ